MEEPIAVVVGVEGPERRRGCQLVLERQVEDTSTGYHLPFTITLFTYGFKRGTFAQRLYIAVFLKCFSEKN